MNFNLWYLIKIKNNYIKRLKRNPNDRHLQDLLKHVSNKVIAAKKSCKTLYYKNLLNNTPHSKLWTHINRIFGKSSKSSEITLKDNGTKINNNQQVCEIFNKYFSSIGQELASRIVVDVSSDPLSCLQRVSGSIFLTPASPSEVTLLINDLAPKKSGGPDFITAEVVKQNCVNFSRILAQIFNKIIDTGTFPDCLKVARVVPIFKSGDAHVSTPFTFNKII